MLVMIITIPILFYGYKMIFKKSILFIDINIFFIAAFLGELTFNLLINNSFSNPFLKHIGIIGLIIIFLIYITRTYVPIKNFLFKDPITKKYGINGHK